MNRVMLVTGGSGSVGSSLAALAAQAGWHVAVHGRRQDRVDAVVAGVLAKVPDAHVTGHLADFALARAFPVLIADVLATHGRIDAVADCSVTAPAGITGRFGATEPANFASLAEVSIVAFQRLAHASLPCLQASRGSLVALVSDAGIHAAPNQTMIGAMRAATIGFVRNLAMEIARDGVRANVVSPSYIEATATAALLAEASPGRLDTGRLEKARARAGLGLPDADDVARLVLFLSGADASKITGQVISINGGLNA